MKVINESSTKKLVDVKVGENVIINDFVNAYNCTIDDGTKIGTFVEIQKNVHIGKNCKISTHTFICEGVTIKNGVFVGHNVSFINDKYPLAVNQDFSLKNDSDWELMKMGYTKDNKISESTKKYLKSKGITNEPCELDEYISKNFEGKVIDPFFICYDLSISNFL